MRRADPFALAAIALFAVLVALAVATSRGGDSGDQGAIGRSGSIYDESAGGASVLRRYLEALGLQVVPVQGDQFAPATANVGVLFLLGATEQLSDADRRALHDFVRQGGTLVIATDLGFNERRLLDEFGVGLSGQRAPAGEIPVRTIAFAAPAVRSLSVDLAIGLAPRDPSTSLVTDGSLPLVVTGAEGRGRVFAIGSLAPFVNGSIGAVDNGRFDLGLAQTATGRVGFDEYHHGVRPAPDVTALLARTWLGRSLIAVFVVVFAYLLLTGRRLGPPLPLDPRPPRSSLEYVRGFAGLVRRSGHGEIARRRLRADLHRGLARGAGLDPETPFERVTNAVAQQSPSRAAEARALDLSLAGRLREDALVRAANDVQRLIHAEEAT